MNSKPAASDGTLTGAIAVPHGVLAADLALDSLETCEQLYCADRPGGDRRLSSERNISSTATLPELCGAPHSSSYKHGFKSGRIIEAGAYLKDVLDRLPAHKSSQIEEFLPHRWKPAGSTGA